MSPAPAKRPARPSAWRAPLLLVVLAGAIAFVGPRLVRAHAALAWTEHHVSQPPDERGEHARGAARSAVEALAQGAPVPWGAYACRLALDFGARQETSNPAAALALYEQVRAGLETTTASRWRGIGLGALLDEARQKEQALRGRPNPAKP
jgi:hypothetical protein